MTPSEVLINDTIKHFGQFQQENISKAEAVEIIENFSGFARLLLTLDKKRQEFKKNAC